MSQTGIEAIENLILFASWRLIGIMIRDSDSVDPDQTLFTWHLIGAMLFAFYRYDRDRRVTIQFQTLFSKH